MPLLCARIPHKPRSSRLRDRIPYLPSLRLWVILRRWRRGGVVAPETPVQSSPCSKPLESERAALVGPCDATTGLSEIGTSCGLSWLRAAEVKEIRVSCNGGPWLHPWQPSRRCLRWRCRTGLRGESSGSDRPGVIACQLRQSMLPRLSLGDRWRLSIVGF
jgi:hypothetical protein